MMSFILISKLKTVITSCNGIQDSLGFLIPHHGFRIPGTGFYILCQWSLDSSCGCADSLCCILDNFKAQDYVFHGKKFPGFQITQAKLFQILLHGVTVI